MARALIWFKRDLRIHDHAPLASAAACEDGLALVVIEPEWLASPECDPQDVAYLGACVDSLSATLAESGLPLLIRVGPMPEVLEALYRETGFTHLFSHEETGRCGAMPVIGGSPGGAASAASPGRSTRRPAWFAAFVRAAAGHGAGRRA
ncbi:hypothetical protein PT2222_420041 [Paraburkholderia tropica]